VLLRCRAGYVSPLRSVDPRILLQWWGYTAGSGAVVFAALHVTPLVFGQ
jgi:cytochrome c oxidase subunit I+III